MELLGREFRTAEKGLDPNEVIEFLKAVTGSSEDAFQRLEQFSALQTAAKTMEESISQARRLAEYARKQAESEAQQKKTQAVEEAGAFAIVMEKIPESLAGEISGKLSIPTIGIGAGPHCDGQILVTQDMLGLFRQYKPKFVRRYAELSDSALQGLNKYVDDVRKGTFPSDEESYD